MFCPRYNVNRIASDVHRLLIVEQSHPNMDADALRNESKVMVSAITIELNQIANSRSFTPH
jgi:hypothetical protein